MKQIIPLLFSLAVINEIAFAQSNVGIGTASPHASAGLDISYTNKGFLPPRVALTGTGDGTTISSPANGLLVYNTATVSDVTPGYYYRIGSVWRRLMTSSEGWLLTGNAGTNPSVNFTGTTDAVDWVVRTNNAARMRITSAGFVGIGTSTPASKLHVQNGNVSVYGALPSDVWGQVIGIGSGGAGGVTQGIIGHQGSFNLDIYWNFHRIDGTSTFTGIGANSYTSANAISMGNTGITFHGTTAMGASKPTERMRIGNDGIVGIGTTSPGGQLHVHAATGVALNVTGGSSGSVLGRFQRTVGSSGIINLVSGGGYVGMNLDEEAGTNYSLAVSSSIFRVMTGYMSSGTDRLVVNSSGNVGIGTSSPSANHRLELNGGGMKFNSSWGIGFRGENAQAIAPIQDGARIYYDDDVFAADNDGLVIEKTDWNNNPGDGGIAFANRHSNNTRTIAMSIRGDGNVGIGVLWPIYKLEVQGIVAGTGWQTLSDARYKTNVETIGNALDKILAVRGASYSYRRDEFPELGFDDKVHLGFVAQEINEVFPEAVRQNREGFYSVDYTMLIPVLVEALKEINGEVESLRKDNRQLQLRLEQLQEK